MAKQWTDERDLPPFQLCQGIASLSSALKQFVDNCKGFLLVRLPQLKSLQLEKGQKKMNLNVIVVGGWWGKHLEALHGTSKQKRQQLQTNTPNAMRPKHCPWVAWLPTPFVRPFISQLNWRLMDDGEQHSTTPISDNSKCRCSFYLHTSRRDRVQFRSCLLAFHFDVLSFVTMTSIDH